jgi:hypothetical protein
MTDEPGLGKHRVLSPQGFLQEEPSKLEKVAGASIHKG